MAIRKGTVRQRILARRLRRLRTAAGLTLEVAAVELEVSQSKLSRIEKAQQGVDIHVAKSMLDLYDLGGNEAAEIKQMVRDARQRAWWRQYGLGDNSYVVLESDAELVQEYAAGIVPGLLQVDDYARALFEASPVPRTPAQRDSEVALRMIRQRRLTDLDNLLQFSAIVDETALHNPVGGPQVLRVQLAHLVEAADLPTVTLQVLPAHPGAHASLGSGFYVLSFGDLGEPDMAYVEHALGATHVEGEEDVSQARKQFDQLCTLALSPAASLALLREIAAAM